MINEEKIVKRISVEIGSSGVRIWRAGGLGWPEYLNKVEIVSAAENQNGVSHAPFSVKGIIIKKNLWDVLLPCSAVERSAEIQKT